MKSITHKSGLFVAGLLIFASLVAGAQEITKKKGRVTCHYANGSKSASGHVDNYRKNGTWKYWDSEGFLHHTSTFVNDTLHGVYTAYDKDKSITIVGNYEHGIKTGVWRFYYADGQPSKEYTYVGGRLDGRQMSWYENGQVHEILVCSDDQVISRKVWYPGGRLRLVENYRNGVNDGTWMTYPDPLTANDTLPSSVDQYADGQLHGWHYAFHNGRKMEEVHYTAGQTDGSCTRWDEHGHLLSVENFKAGRRDGACRYYDCQGLLREVTYADGTQNGPFVDYDRNGDTLFVSWYSKGVRDSVKTYYPNGVVATRRVYAIASDNFEHSEYIEYDEQGRQLVYGRYIGNVRYGEWYTYYPNGKKKSCTNYKNGKVCGVYTKWYDSGSRMIEFTINEDSTQTTPVVWTEQGRLLRAGTPSYNEIVESAHPGETYTDPLDQRAVIDQRMAQAAKPYLKFEAVPAQNTSDEQVYTNPDFMPEFPGGAQGMQNYLHRHLVHPVVLQHMSGTVMVSYVVEKDGAITDVRVVQEVQGAPEFTMEALRVVHSFPTQQPGTVDGAPVRCRVIVPVRFAAR